MLHETFNRAYAGLVRAFTRYHDSTRSPDAIPELGAARKNLDAARNVARQAREAYLSTDRPTVLNPRQTGVGDDDLARLRVLGTGFIQG
jgi:hypothetical protein